MSVATFDTLKFVETLKASGFDDAQAKGVATAFREAQSVQIEDLAAKRDLKELEGQVATKADVAKVESQLLEVKGEVKELKRDMKEMELRMVIKTGGMILAGIGILFGLMRTWPPPVQYLPSPAQEMRYMPPATQLPVPFPSATNNGK